MIFPGKEGVPRRTPPACLGVKLRRLPLGHYGVTNCGIGRRLHRLDLLLKRFHLLPFNLPLRGAVAQADFMLLGLQTENLEIVFAARIQNGSYARAPRRLFLITVEFPFTFFDLRDVAEAFDAFGQFHEGAEIGGPGDFAFQNVADFMAGEPIGPNILHLLDAERKPAVLRVHLQHFRFDGIALLEFFAGMLDALGPTDIADVNQAFHAFFDFHKCAKIGKIANAAIDDGADRIFFRSGVPGIGHGLFQSEGNAALVGLYFEHGHFDFVPDLSHFRGVLRTFRPAHLADVHETFDSRFDLDKRAVVRYANDFPLCARAYRKTLGNGGPGIRQKLLAAQRDALLVLIKFQDLDFDLITRLNDGGWMRHASPNQIADVKQPVNPAEIYENAIVRYVFNAAGHHGIFRQRRHQRIAF